MIGNNQFLSLNYKIELIRSRKNDTRAETAIKMRHLTLEFALNIVVKKFTIPYICNGHQLQMRAHNKDTCLQHKISDLNLKDSEPLIYICSYNTKIMNTLK